MNYWPMIHGSKWEARRFDLTDLLIKMGNARGMDVFIDASAGVDIKNVTRRILQVSYIFNCKIKLEAKFYENHANERDIVHEALNAVVN